jgi:hypothetical protein
MLGYLAVELSNELRRRHRFEFDAMSPVGIRCAAKGLPFEG